jgi:hypothetical protein
MRRTISYTPLSSSDLDVNPTIDVVIAYQDLETGKSAKNTYDFLVEHLGHECEFSSQMWKFDVLAIPKLREIAAKDGAAADIIIISCHGGELPAEVKAWIELWLAEETKPIALVALFGPGEVEGTEAIRSYLAGVAKRGRMEFFAQPDEWPGSKPSETSFLIRRETGQDRALSMLAGAMNRETSFPRWGINE